MKTLSRMCGWLSSVLAGFALMPMTAEAAPAGHQVERENGDMILPAVPVGAVHFVQMGEDRDGEMDPAPKPTD